MSVELVGLALLMGLVTYPSRALPMLVPGIDRLPTAALDYLRLVGPAVLASLAAVGVMVTASPAGQPAFHVGIEWAAVVVCGAITAWRRNLLLGLIGAVVLVAIARAAGVAALLI
jgi:branched-subunit amino acid transport protein